MNEFFWNAFAFQAGVIFFIIIVKEKERRWLLYGLMGSLLGFMFDSLSVYQGYYAFDLPNQLLGVPITVTLAEAFSVVITIFIFEKLVLPRLPEPSETKIQQQQAPPQK